MHETRYSVSSFGRFGPHVLDCLGCLGWQKCTVESYIRSMLDEGCSHRFNMGVRIPIGEGGLTAAGPHPAVPRMFHGPSPILLYHLYAGMTERQKRHSGRLGERRHFLSNEPSDTFQLVSRVPPSLGAAMST